MTLPPPRWQRAPIVVAAGVALLVGCTATTDPAPTPLQTAAPEGGESGWHTPAAAGTVGMLPTERLSGAVEARVAKDLAPPTSRWFSGLVFGDAPQPVFPFPLAFAMNGGGFTIDLPEVAASEKTIAAPFAGGLAVDLGAESFEVIRYDPVSVTMRVDDAEGALGEITIAEGSPVVAFTASRDVTLTPAADLESVDPESGSSGLWTAEADNTTFGVKSEDATWNSGGLQLPSGKHAQWFALPDDGDIRAWGEALHSPVTAVAVAYATDDDASTTRLTYEGTASTIVVPFPAQSDTASSPDECGLGVFTTAYGAASACTGTSLEWSVPDLAARDTYDADALDDETRQQLATQIDSDLVSTAPLPADTYFGGKGLARLGALLSLARSIGESDLADRVAERLEAELKPWVKTRDCEARCFVYDDALHLVVGKPASFGSEQGNDHHFHFGYFLAAAAALAEAKPETLSVLAPVMDALAADIATGDADEGLPSLRVFDPYRGHSWAAGLSPFADGNNQESSSEAVAAWNGLAMWAKARGDGDLESRAQWMLSAEAHAARALWLEPDPDDLADGFGHKMVSLTWGGKRDYRTWFSAEPSAILGIQILPVGPISLDYLTADPARVAENVAEAGGQNAFDGALGEYVMLYSALAGDDALEDATAAATALTPAEIDDGTSLSAILAWLAAVRASRLNE